MSYGNCWAVVRVVAFVADTVVAVDIAVVVVADTVAVDTVVVDTVVDVSFVASVVSSLYAESTLVSPTFP